MKKLLYFLIYLAFTLCFEKTNAQPTYTFAKALSGPGASWGKAIKVDASGNIYTAGAFYGVCDFDPGPGTYTLASTGSGRNFFVSKLDADGNFIWARGGANNADITSLVVDITGNVILTGAFGGVPDFDFGIGTYTLSSNGWQDIFIFKLDGSGNFVWAKQMGSTRTDVGFSVAVDASGNVFTSGFINYTVDFDPGPGTYTLGPNVIDESAVFISKLDAAGNFIWAKKIESRANTIPMSVDGYGNIYLSGYFNNTVDFDLGAGTYNLTPSISDIFVLKLDPSGNFVWVRQMGGPSSDWIYSMAVDKNGNVYTVGHLSNGADFDPGPGTFFLSPTADWLHFISKLDAAGNFVWAKRMGGNYNPTGLSIAIDLYSNVYTTAIFTTTINLNPMNQSVILTPKGEEDIYIHQLDPSGNFLWAGQIGGYAHDQVCSIVIDGCGSIYTTGYFQFTTDFDPGSDIQNLAFDDEVDAFVSKLGQIPLAPTITPFSNTICVGRSITMNASSNWLGAASWNWYTDGCGSTFAGTGSSIVVSPTLATTYFVRAENSCYATECASVTINTIISPEADFETSYSITCQGLATTYFNKSKNADSYSWNFSDESSTENNVGHTFNYNEASVASLIAINNNGCSDTLKVENAIGEFTDYFNIRLPNVFTPNNDGINDEFKIDLSEDIAGCSDITIFDRWGKLLFSSTDQNLNWDGRTSAGTKAVAGVYFYILKINGQKYNGSLTLLD